MIHRVIFKSIVAHDNDANRTHAYKIMADARIAVIRAWMARLNVPAMRIQRRLMKAECAFRRIILAMIVDSSAVMENVFRGCGLAMAMMIAVIIAMKIKTTARSIHVRQMNSVVTMAAVYSNPGNVTWVVFCCYFVESLTSVLGKKYFLKINPILSHFSPYSSMKMTAKMDLMKRAAHIHHVSMVNSPV